MRFRPQTWLLLSVLLFLAGGYVWHLANEREARKHPAPVKPRTSSQQPKAPWSAQPRSSFLAQLAAQAGRTNAAVTNAAAARTNRFAHRLANTTLTVGQLARRDNAILLENALIDTELPAALAIPRHLRAAGDPGAYLVQSRGPIDDAFRALLRDAGAEIVSYIPNNAYLVRATAAQVASLAERGLSPSRSPAEAGRVGTTRGPVAAAAQVQAVLPYEPYYKLKSELLKLAVEQQPLPPDSALNVLLFADNRAATTAQLQRLGAEIVGEDRSPFGPVLKVRTPPDALAAVAGLSGVQEVELLRRRAPVNDLTRLNLHVSPDTTGGSTNNYLGLTGTNVTVAVNDSGVDATHPDLSPRVTGDVLTDATGHGTHVAGIIAASGLKSDTVSNAMGSINPGVLEQYRGKAPDAGIFSLGIFGTAFIPDGYLQEAAARTNVFISNNSWGYVGDNSYNIVSASYDAATRDSLPGDTGSQPVLYVFAAGNDGGGDDNGLGGEPDNLNAPATAKNVISVGATELLRNITNEVEVYLPGTDTNGQPITVTNIIKPFLGTTDSSNQVASFSSRGNVGIFVEGDFGRFKPDVVAPGSFVVSTRSTQWDTNAYYNPTNIYRSVQFGVTLEAGERFDDFLFVPANAAWMRLTLTNLFFDPLLPLPPLPIYADANTQPPATLRDSSQATINFSATDPNNAFWFLAVLNPYPRQVTFDVLLELAVTNDSNSLTVLSNLNSGLEPWYRYESGTSMAAPAVSGVLALLQQFFEESVGQRPSPALMKALLINGARSVNEDLYDLQVKSGINYQGWGLVNLTNCLPEVYSNAPSLLTNTLTGTASPLKLFEQNPAEALATGQGQTRTITIANEAALNRPLRVTLVWTDPPANPVASFKLVNDLDLVVTNLDTGDVYFGNDLLANRNFNLPWDTNLPPAVDYANNVENVYLDGTPDQPLGNNYSITVIGRRVNVNAVTAHSNNVVQDYALVISSGNGSITNAIIITADSGVTALDSSNVVTNNTSDRGTFPLLTYAPDGVPLLDQRVGASSPLVGTNTVPKPAALGVTNVITLGITNQWHFYVFTNTGSNVVYGDLNNSTNVAFITFLPPTLAVPRMGTREQVDPDNNASRPEADIDLYVSTSPDLTNLTTAAILTADKSLERGGTEFIVYTNSSLGQVYYIGVKSEDRQAANYGFFAIATDVPFTEETNGNVLVNGMPPHSVDIPDGSPLHPGAGLVFGINPITLDVRRVVVTNVVEHELFGDLLGNFSHPPGSDSKFAVLNNHTSGQNDYINRIVYDDIEEGNTVPPDGKITGSIFLLKPSDGPGNLRNFMGVEASGVWLLTMVDNSPFQTGRVDNLTFFLERHVDATNGVEVTIGAGGTYYDYVDVPPEATSFTNLLSFGGTSTGPVDFYIRYGHFPNPNNYDFALTGIRYPGAELVIDRLSNPPLRPGRYFIAIFNPTAVDQIVRWKVRFGLDENGVVPTQFVLSGPQPILDDAVTTTTTNSGSITVPGVPGQGGRVYSAEVGLRIDHPRISDLAITLVSPGGTRVLLSENRGGDTTNGFGSPVNITNVYETATGTNLGSLAVTTNIIDVGWNTGTLIINYDFLNIPNSLSVYWDGERKFFSGFINGTGTYTIPFTSLSNVVLTIIMHEDAPILDMSGWSYTPTVITRATSYLTFTEDPDKTQTPIKFGQPPFSLTFQVGPVFTNGFENAFGTSNYTAPDVFDGWKVENNRVTVFSNAELARAGSKFLGLRDGEVSRGDLPTGQGRKYRLSFGHRNRENLDPSHWWPGDGNAIDIVGGVNGVFTNGASATATGRVNQAFALNRTNSQSVNFGPDAGNFGTDDFTIDFWIKTTDLYQEAILSKRSACGAAGWSVLLNGGTNYNVAFRFGSPADLSVTSTRRVNDGNWHHVAFVRQETNAALFVDGVLDDSGSSTSLLVVSNAASLIAGFEPCIGTRYFNGQLDEIAFYDRALSAAQINDIYAAGADGKCGTPTPPAVCDCPSLEPAAWWPGNGDAVDVIGGLNGTLSGGVTYQAGEVAGAFKFSGASSDRVQIGDPDTLKLTNSLSIDAWIKVTGLPTVYAPILFRGDTRVALDPYYLAVIPSGGLRFHIEDTTSIVNLETAPIGTNQWRHVAAVFNASTNAGLGTFTMQVYVDGNLMAQTNTTIRPFRDLNTGFSPGVSIGNFGPGSQSPQPFNGLIDELAVYNRALTAAQIKGIYAAGAAGKSGTPAPPTVCHGTYRSGILAGPIVNPANGHRYYLAASNTWTGAEALAVALGGHLVTVNDAAENAWITNTYSRYGGVNRALWIGLNDAAQEGTFVWASGEPVTYLNWAGNQPDNCGDEDYTHIFEPGDGRRGYWNDQDDFGRFCNSGPVIYTLYGVIEVADCVCAECAGASGGAVLSVPNKTVTVISTNTYWQTKSFSFTAITNPTPLDIVPLGGGAGYDARADFSTNANPNNTWSYGWSDGLAGAFVPFTNAVLSPINNGREEMWYAPAIDFQYTPSVARNSGGDFDDGNVTFDSGALILHPSGNTGRAYAHVLWTAPDSGTYTLNSRFFAQQNNIDVDVHVLVNGGPVFDSTITSNGVARSFSGRFTLIAGDTLDFAVGPNGNFAPHPGNTGLEVSIGSPSGVLLDQFVLTELPSDLYYLPEESLEKLKGENVFGEWKLELWDNRAGMTASNALQSWQLSFVLDNYAGSACPSPRLRTFASPVSVAELTTLTVNNAASPVNPLDPLTYSLQNPPLGASIDGNGVITWTPLEVQGSNVFTLTTVVTENGAFSCSASNSLTVIVNEVNEPPVLPVVPDQIALVDEELVVDNGATDPDFPPNTLTYQLLAGPAGMTIDPGSGLITWTPTAGQLGTNWVTTVVTDNNPAAVNAQQLSDTNTFAVMVTNLVISFTTGIPAFPGAEGAGGYAVGGRGGDVYHVTTLSNSGPGSLRDGLTRSHRTIVFDVSGTIELLSPLRISRPYLTLAGQTAPGDGISVKGWVTSVRNTHNVVIRHLRFRAGDVNCPANQDDTFQFLTVTNSIADHITATWSIDETLSITHSTNVTVQWSVIADSLNDACHDKGDHGYGSLLRYSYGAASLHHNLYANHNSRNPRLGDNITLDFVNNVICNWGGLPGYSGADDADNPSGFTNRMNYVGNYVIAGTNSSAPARAFRGGSVNTWIFQTNNLIDPNLNGVLDGSDTGWAMFQVPYTPVGAPFSVPGIAVTGDTAPLAYERVLAFVGASPTRDTADLDIVKTVRNQNGFLIDSQDEVGGWPVLDSRPTPLDTDQDGMPDYWEITLTNAFGLDPANPDDLNLTNAIGYTRLEDYLNWLADPHAVANTNQPVDIDLLAIAGNTGNLAFSVANGTNGTVLLLADGHTAQFTPDTNYSGFASFNFTVTNLDTSVAFGPVDVSVLVSAVPVDQVARPTISRVTWSTAGTTLEWNATTNQQFQVQWAAELANPPPSTWTSFTNIITSASGLFTFTDDGSQTGGLGPMRFYRLLALP